MRERREKGEGGKEEGKRERSSKKVREKEGGLWTNCE